VAANPDLGPQPYGDSAPALRATHSVLGGRPVILRLTPKTAALVGETPAEWQLLEKQVRAGRWTSGPRTDAERLRALAAELWRGSAEGRRGGVETAATGTPWLERYLERIRPLDRLRQLGGGGVTPLLDAQ
jgi:hypothetical protein